MFDVFENSISLNRKNYPNLNLIPSRGEQLCSFFAFCYFRFVWNRPYYLDHDSLEEHFVWVGQHRDHLSPISFAWSTWPAMSYLKRDERRESEVLVGQHQQDHLAGHQQDHPWHQDLLPGQVLVNPACQNLGLSTHNFFHLGLKLLLLSYHRNSTQLSQLGRGAQTGRNGFWFRRHFIEFRWLLTLCRNGWFGETDTVYIITLIIHWCVTPCWSTVFKKGALSITKTISLATQNTRNWK